MLTELDFQDVHVEQALLSSLMRGNGKLVLELDLSEIDFFDAFNWLVYKEITDQILTHGRVMPADLALLAREEAHREYILNLFDNPLSTTPDSARTYTERLKDLRRKREILRAIQDVESTLADDDKTAKDAINAFGQNLSTDDIAEFKTRAEIQDKILKSLDMPRQSYSVGIPSLDLALGGGLYEGYTYGFCGAEKQGKTTLAHTMSFNLAKQGTKHLYVAMEMGSEQIEQRNISREMGINSLAFLNNRDQIKQRQEKVTFDNNIIYLDLPGGTLTEILHKLAVAKPRFGIKGYIIDYWQLVGGRPKGESEESHLRNVAQSFANFSRKNKLWCILLAQMNKEGSLFGGNGLRKACDQLYMIESMEPGLSTEFRWLRMDASRYTMRGDLGGPLKPALKMDTKAGPHFTEAA